MSIWQDTYDKLQQLSVPIMFREFSSDYDKAQGIVYEITCLKTGKRYIGATACSLHYRWARHIDTACNKRAQTRFAIHIRRHRPRNFEVKILASCLDLCELAEIEMAIIHDRSPELNSSFHKNDIWSDGKYG